MACCRSPSMLVALCLCVSATAMADTGARAALPGNTVDGFNRALADATRHMDNTAMLALWEESGVSLLPQTPPLEGRAAIAAFLQSVTAQMPAGRMEIFELQCHDTVQAGDLATEWCEEHQRVRLGADKPPFEGWGKMLLVLHRGPDGQWRLLREMWNQGIAQPGGTAG